MSDNPVHMIDGDPGVVRGVAWGFGELAGEAEDLLSRLARLDVMCGSDAWSGPAADRFAELAREVRPAVQRFAASHRDAQDAISTYANALDDAQRRAQDAYRAAATALAARDDARRRRATAATEAAGWDNSARAYAANQAEAQAKRSMNFDPSYDAALLDYEQDMRAGREHAESRAGEARRRESSAQVAESAAEAHLAAAAMLGRQAAELRDDASRQAVIRLESAGDRAPRPPSIVKRISHAITTVTDHPRFSEWMQQLSDVGDILVGVGRIVAFFPAAQGWAAGLITAGLVLKGLAAALTFVAWRRGKVSRNDVVYRAGDFLLSAVSARGALGAAGKIKRALYFDDARAAQGAWRSVKVAKGLGTAEGMLAQGMRISPRLYFRAATAVELGIGAGEDVNSIIESGRNWTAPIPRKNTDLTELRNDAIKFATGKLVGKVHEQDGVAVLGGATSELSKYATGNALKVNR